VLEAEALDDPHAAAVAYLEGRAHEMQARWTDAAAAYARALALEPDLAAARRGRAQSLTAAGRREAALAALIEAAPGDDGPPPADLTGAWSRLCRDEPSAEAMRACVLAGRSERAERLLLAAAAARVPFVVLAPHDALLQPLRRGPAMRALVARLQQPPPRSAQP
jgi:tetratricopeptide (TPR) repeat protein